MQWDFSEQCSHFFWVCLNVSINGCMDRSWPNVVDGDIVGGEFQADGAHQHAHAAFGTTIGHVLRHGQVLVDGGDVDDASRDFAFDHLAGGGLSAEKGTFQVDADDTIKHLLGDIDEGAVDLHTGVVDHDVEAIEVLNRLLDE